MRRVLVCTILSLGLASAVRAEVAVQTSLPQACKGASYVLVAELVRDQYEALDEGKATAIDVAALWSEFKVSKTLKAPKGAASLDGKTLRLVDENNSCIRWSTTATRRGDEVSLVHDHGSGRIERKSFSLTSMKKKRLKKVILFIGAWKDRAGKLRRSHFGSGISPTGWSKKLDAQVRACLDPKSAKKGKSAKKTKSKKKMPSEEPTKSKKKMPSEEPTKGTKKGR